MTGRDRLSIIVALLFLALALTGPLAQGQSLCATHGELLAATGLPVPGLPGVTFANPFEDACIDSQGRIGFVTGLSGAGVSASNGEAVLFGQPNTDLGVIVRAGAPVASLPGVTLGPELGRKNSGGVLRISGDGSSFVVTSTLVGPGVSRSTDGVLIGGPMGNPDVLVREGEPAPGNGPGIFGAGLDSAFAGQLYIDDSGRILIANNINFGSNPTFVNYGICAGMPGSLSLAQRVGGSVFGANVQSVGFSASANQAGQVLYQTVLSRFVGVTPATITTDEIVWRWTPGIGNEIMVRESDPVADIPGAIFGRSSNAGFAQFGPPTFNQNGAALLRCSFLGGGAIPSVNDEGLFVATPGNLSLTVRKGDLITGTSIAVHFRDSTPVFYESNGDVLFSCELIGPGITSQNNTAICRWSNGVLSMVAQKGNLVVGTVGARLGNLSDVSPQSNDRGQVLIIAPLIGGDTIPGNSGNDSALVAFDPDLGMILVLRKGESFPLPTGNVHTPWIYWAATDNTGDGATAGMNHNGDLVIRSVTTSFPIPRTYAIFRTHIGSLGATPSTIPFATGGVQTFTLNGGTSRAGQAYLLAGTMSGTTPGFTSGGFTVPLNPDPYFDFSTAMPNIGVFNNTTGFLDARGIASASITVPPSLLGLSGLEFHHAFVTVDNAGQLDFVSETAKLTITP